MTSSTDIKFIKSKTLTDVDIASFENYSGFYNGFENTGTYNIIDCQGLSESEISYFIKNAIENLPKKENLVIGHHTEALNSVYWNIIFYILQEAGYKQILWIDGGLTKGHICRHVEFLNVKHIFSSFFFKDSFRINQLGEMPPPGEIDNKSKLFICISRKARQERLYLTSKILKDEELSSKGIISCAWGKETKHIFEDENLDIFLDKETKNLFPVTLDHEETDNAIYGYHDELTTAIFNIVQEGTIGYDHRAHNKVYNKVPIEWYADVSDRVMFTEKTAKPFCCNQIPLFIAAPGFVEILRRLGFDVFDDIVDHSYDKEDNSFKRCDLVFEQIKNISQMRTVKEWINFLKEKNISNRFIKNRERLEQIFKEQDMKSYSWVKDNF